MAASMPSRCVVRASSKPPSSRRPAGDSRASASAAGRRRRLHAVDGADVLLEHFAGARLDGAVELALATYEVQRLAAMSGAKRIKIQAVNAQLVGVGHSQLANQNLRQEVAQAAGI